MSANNNLNVATFSNGQEPKGQERYPIRLLLILPLILMMALIVYLYYPSNDEAVIESENLQSQATKALTAEKELEIIANQLIDNNNNWDHANINKFILLWNSLSKPIRQDLVDSTWYKHFVFVLDTKLKRKGDLYSKAGLLEGSSNDPIITLAYTLDVVTSKQKSRKRRKQNTKFKQLLAKVKSEISKADSARQIDSRIVNSSPLLNDAMRQKFEVDNSRTSSLVRATRIQKTSPINLEASMAITGDKIRQILAELKDAYYKGDLNRLQTIFQTSDESSNSTLNNISARELLNEYDANFSMSRSQSLDLSKVAWQYGDGKAIGSGLYKAVHTYTDSNDTQTVTASVVINLSILEGKLLISKIDFQNKNIVNSNPSRNIPIETPVKEVAKNTTSDLPLPPTIMPPNDKELENVLSNFVSAYESGNIDLLVSVFAKNVRTNERTNLKEIKKDYVDLFQKSSKRKMIIEGMRWKYRKNSAKGIGNLSAAITLQNGDSINVLKGKIEIVAQRINGDIFITHLYHIEHNQ